MPDLTMCPHCRLSLTTAPRGAAVCGCADSASTVPSAAPPPPGAVAVTVAEPAPPAAAIHPPFSPSPWPDVERPTPQAFLVPPPTVARPAHPPAPLTDATVEVDQPDLAEWIEQPRAVLAPAAPTEGAAEPPAAQEQSSPPQLAAVVATVDVAGPTGSAATTDAGSAAPPEAVRIVDTGRGWGIRQHSSLDAGATAARRSAPPPPVLAPVPSWTPLAAYASAPPERPHRAGMRLAITAVAVAVLGLVAWSGWSGGLGGLFRTAQPLSRPGSIGTLTRIEAPALDGAAAAMQSRLAGAADTTVAGVYGTDNVPQLIFVAGRGGGAGQTAADLTAEIDATATPFAGPPTVTTVQRQMYICGSVAAANSAPATMCAWTDTTGAGLVVNIASADLTGTLTLATQARAAAER